MGDEGREQKLLKMKYATRRLFVISLLACLSSYATGGHPTDDQRHRKTRNRPKGRNTMIIDLEHSDVGDIDTEYVSFYVYGGKDTDGEETKSSNKVKGSKKSAKGMDDSTEQDFFGVAIGKGKNKGKGSSKDESIAPSTQPQTKYKSKKRGIPSDKTKMSTKKSKRSKSSPTNSPTLDPNVPKLTRHLTPYGLNYTVTETDRIPFRSEILEVIGLTRDYLETVFEETFGDDRESNLIEFLTIFVDIDSTLGMPVYIAYNSSASFESSSAIIPSVDVLDQILNAAFEGNNLDGYLEMLQALPQNNLFSKTVSVVLIEVESIDTNTSSKSMIDARSRTGSTTVNVVAGAAGAAVVAAAAIYSYRKKHDEQKVDNKTDGNDIATITTGTSTTALSTTL